MAAISSGGQKVKKKNLIRLILVFCLCYPVSIAELFVDAQERLACLCLAVIMFSL